MATQPTIENLVDPRYTDVVLWEEVNGHSYDSRDIVSVTATAGGTFKQGAIMFRAKGTDAAAVWDFVDAAGDIAITNEYAVLIGDDFEPSETVTFTTAVNRKAIALVRRARLKEAGVRAAVVGTFAAVSDANMASLIRLLAVQGILVDGSLTAIPA